jgi:hypothetical protein
MTEAADLASQVAQLRSELAELRAGLGRQPAAGLATAPLVNVQLTRRYAGQGYDDDPAHDPRVTEAILRGAGDAEISGLLAEAAAGIEATAASRRQGPARPAELEALDRQARRAGRAVLGRAMVPGQRGQAVAGAAGQFTTPLGEVSCEYGHGRPLGQPAARFCPIDGMPFLTADQMREAEDAMPRRMTAEDFQISRLAGRMAPRIPEPGPEENEADRRERAARALAEALPPGTEEIEAAVAKRRKAGAP